MYSERVTAFVLRVRLFSGCVMSILSDHCVFGLTAKHGSSSLFRVFGAEDFGCRRAKSLAVTQSRSMQTMLNRVKEPYFAKIHQQPSNSLNRLLLWSICVVAITFALFAAFPGSALAQAGGKREAGKNDGSTAKSRRNAPKSTPGMTKAREAAALAFVREHHAELEELLIQLGESQPKQYEAAIRDLFRTSERLAAFHERDSDRYAMELTTWKLNSRVQLLSARLLMTPADKQLREKLKQAMLDHAAVRRELLTLERERVTKRLDKIEAQIKSIDQGAERMVDRQIKNLLDGPQKSDVKTSSGK